MSTSIPDTAIGLTGGIACGKSTLAAGLAARGWHVIDTDEIARRVLTRGEGVYKIVVDVFGPSILQADQSIDRKVLGNLVFADPLLRAKLNEITHPAIRSVWQREREERARTHPTHPLVVMIPLLFECELEKSFSAVWCVGASRAAQLRRLKARGLSAQESANRIDSQMPVAAKMARAHVSFWGEGTPAMLLAQLDHVFHEESPLPK